MSSKIIIVLEIEGDAASARQVVEGALDAGIIQNEILGYEHDGEPFTIVSATSRADALDDDGESAKEKDPAMCGLFDGWALFDSGVDDWEIQRCDEADLFESDDAAREHIRGCAHCRTALVYAAEGLSVEDLLNPPAVDEEA